MPAPLIVEILIEKILPNPDNPRGSVSPEDAQAMDESMKEVGQSTEVRVRPLTEAEKAQHPGYEWFLIGGHRRLAGAKLAGIPVLRAVVLEAATPDKELDDALLDNRSTDMGWWRWDFAIEKRINLPPKIHQERLAARLGV